MSRKYSSLAALKTVPQSEPISDTQVQNNAGGYVYQLDQWARLDRFLVLGSDAATYYQEARKLTRENAKVVDDCYGADAAKTVSAIVEISVSGRAPKNDAAIFALALGASHGDEVARRTALCAMPLVCRTSTHLFQFIDNCRALNRGWGRAMKRAVASWYNSKPVEKVAYQMIKYRQREGYTHKRALELSHASALNDPSRKALYLWAKGKLEPENYKGTDIAVMSAHWGAMPRIIDSHETAMNALLNDSDLVRLVREDKLPWEALPTDAMNDPKIWQAMLPDMGMTAMIRNLGKMTGIEAIKPMSAEEGLVVTRLLTEAELKKARIHPFGILLALSTYGAGHGFRGSNTWTPNQRIMDALDKAFYKSFKTVVPSGKRMFFGLDVSGSMSSPFMGSPITCSQGCAVLALVSVATEPRTYVAGFADRMRMFDVKASDSLEAVTQRISNLTFGGTDAALPMLYALEYGLEVDCFVVITDNETWAGRVHPSEALREYRRKTGINAKLVVVGMTSTGFSIADPADGGMLDIVGFDANCPALISDFARG
jgi:60 kDa SS-A/Ro ribonucleoprotein